MDYLSALGVAIAVLVITVAASFPMVAFYAYFIEPGHPQEFYTQSAQWIAPWSSHILGPIVFFGLNYWCARRSPARNALAFAVASWGFYALVDFSMLPAMGIDIRSVLTLGMGLWLLLKLAGAVAGAWTGSKRVPGSGTTTSTT